MYFTGKTYRVGSVDDGTTVTDWMPQELERGITIVSAAVTAEWKDYRINIIDTPGHDDFTAEVQRCLRVLDGGVVVFDAVQGWSHRAKLFGARQTATTCKRICFVNKMDAWVRPTMTPSRALKNRLGAVPIPMQIPIGSEAAFRGVVDLLTMQAIYWNDDLGKDMVYEDIPADMKDEAIQKRAALVKWRAVWMMTS